jgi:hypothetical protein
MAESPYPLWEYRVEDFGGIIKSEPKREIFQDLLNGWGADGWEVVSAVYSTGTTRLRIIAKRLLTAAARRKRSMPSLEMDPG